MRFLVVALCALAGCDSDSTSADLSTTISCQSSADCPAELPTCDPGAKICTGCFPEMNTCSKGNICDPATHVCVPKPPGAPECTRNADCPPIGEVSQRATCAIDLGICVQCLIDDDCGPPTPVCDNGANRGVPDLGRPPSYACIDGCSLCAPPLPVCDRPNARCVAALDAGVPD